MKASESKVAGCGGRREKKDKRQAQQPRGPPRGKTADFSKRRLQGPPKYPKCAVRCVFLRVDVPSSPSKGHGRPKVPLPHRPTLLLLLLRVCMKGFGVCVLGVCECMRVGRGACGPHFFLAGGGGVPGSSSTEKMS